jgi:acetate kinase
MPETYRIANGETIHVLPRGGNFLPLTYSRIEPDLLDTLQTCIEHWPIENSASVREMIAAAETAQYQHQWVACETAFFQTLPEAKKYYALPNNLRQTGYQRFGGDGLFHQWAAQIHSEDCKFVSVHLSENPSIAAIHNERAVDCSMGYSHLEGLPGLTTCGEIDPSVVLFLAEQGKTAGEIADLLYHDSGWQVFASGRSFTELWNDPQNGAFFQKMYLHTLIEAIGAMIASLGGADVIFLGSESSLVFEEILQQIESHFADFDLPFKFIEVSRRQIIEETFNYRSQ